ncbi:MAG: hypothetical protein LKJ90_03915 [Faecalibacterium sp.]|nr:hypothetical protein [Faecalibacterium sp.]
MNRHIPFCKKDCMPLRIAMTLIGIFFTALSVALFRKISWGVDPFTCLVEAVENITHGRFGVVFTAVQVVLLVVTFCLGRHYIGLGTLLTMFGMGVFVDGISVVVEAIAPAPGVIGKAVMFVLGFLVLCFGAALYITSDLGVSSYDAMALILTERKLAKFRVCRILTDCICVAVGFFFSANIGLATVLTAFFMGPLVSWMQAAFAVPLLARAQSTAKK